MLFLAISINMYDYSFDLDNNQGFAVSGVGGKEQKTKTLNKFLTDLQSQFDLDRSPARLEWLQCYLSK